MKPLIISADLVAEMCHEVNRAYCAAIGDTSQKPWAEAADWQRNSAIRGVEFAIKNEDATPESQHLAWMADKTANGWRYGAVKDPVAKTHPCMVPYDKLPQEQRVKDYLFQAVVRTSISMARQ